MSPKMEPTANTAKNCKLIFYDQAEKIQALTIQYNIKKLGDKMEDVFY